MSYEQWSATCDTLHAHTQVLGKLAVALAPPEPQLQHAALRLTARGWETAPLPAPDGSGRLVVLLDLHAHEAVAEHSDGRTERVPLTPTGLSALSPGTCWPRLRRLAGDVRDRSDAAGSRRGAFRWTSTTSTRPTTRSRSSAYFEAAGRAAMVLTEFRAPYRGRSTPVNAWWGSFDLAVSLFSGQPADPPSGDFIMRNAMDAQEVAVGWWPGDPRHPAAAFYAYAHPAPPGYGDGKLSPAAAHWDAGLGEYILNWDDVRTSPDPHAAALEFARSAFMHACAVCGWDRQLAASAQGHPPPVH